MKVATADQLSTVLGCGVLKASGATLLRVVRMEGFRVGVNQPSRMKGAYEIR
jgi:hypothetical protein